MTRHLLPTPSYLLHCQMVGEKLPGRICRLALKVTDSLGNATSFSSFSRANRGLYTLIKVATINFSNQLIIVLWPGRQYTNWPMLICWSTRNRKHPVWAWMAMMLILKYNEAPYWNLSTNKMIWFCVWGIDLPDSRSGGCASSYRFLLF